MGVWNHVRLCGGGKFCGIEPRDVLRSCFFERDFLGWFLFGGFNSLAASGQRSEREDEKKDQPQVGDRGESEVGVESR